MIMEIGPTSLNLGSLDGGVDGVDGWHGPRSVAQDQG